MKGECRPPLMEMRLLMLNQDFKDDGGDQDCCRGVHNLVVQNLDPSIKQKVRIEYLTDSSAARFCRCENGFMCNDLHRRTVYELRTKAEYWHGETKTVRHNVSWFKVFEPNESDFTLSINVESRLYSKFSDEDDPETGLLNVYVQL